MAPRRAVVTGASSGIGAATVRLLRSRGWDVLAVARREAKLQALAEETGATYLVVDVTDPSAVAALASRVAELGGVDVLVNNAGGALGSASVEESDVEDWRAMFEVNVIGTKQVTAALLPALRGTARSNGHADIVTVTSTAGHVAYENGGGYNAAKFAEHALVGALRLELNGEPIRVVEIAPGLVKTDEFALTRFRGDEAKAAAVYDDVPEPLVAEDVAEAIAHAVELPAHVNLDLVTVRPVAQSAQHKLARGRLTPRD
ncbi:SDR family oxidoreductase [Curtobacterium sp. 458]|uniref:SDR family oxidoreductase n=1 Tax=Curtobacterium sp. 458 TaxID=3050069 RepID=UPI0025B3624E|nr:SDR family oxidoreductase [Curtobacterium sp. 458]WJX99135.1 SDR family oxidoreductase [Curtobacterium sp. 458]